MLFSYGIVKAGVVQRSVHDIANVEKGVRLPSPAPNETISPQTYLRKKRVMKKTAAATAIAAGPTSPRKNSEMK